MLARWFAVAMTASALLYIALAPSTALARKAKKYRGPPRNCLRITARVGFRTFAKLGTGAGLRVRWGETFLIRFDGAYSPTEHTPGFYVDIGHVF